MKTNVTCSLDADLVARLDAWRAPMNCGRSHALELLLESLPFPGEEAVPEPTFDPVVIEESTTPLAPPAEEGLPIRQVDEPVLPPVAPEAPAEEPPVSRRPRKS